MATNFDSLLSNLHTSASLQDNYETDNTVIVIDAKRQFTPGSTFDTIVAFEGDINSQIITFKCVRYTDKHDLSACLNKELKWKNRASGIEGVSKLLLISDKTTETDFYIQWELPSEACTQAGQLEISIQLYDKQNNYIAFSWNTSTYTGLSIAASMPSVTTDLEFNFPPRDEILLVDRETRNILAPSGYNNIICNHGDVGIARVSFLIERYIGRNKNLDVFDTNTTIYLFVKQNNTLLIEEKELEKRLYSEELSDRTDKKEGLVFFDWIPDADFTCSGISPYNIGKFDISIKITTKDKQKIWNSNSYGKLELGPSPTMITTQESEEDIDVPVISLTDITDAHYLDSDFKIQEKYYEAADINNISDAHYLDGNSKIKEEYYEHTDINNITDTHYLSGGKIKADYLPSYVDDVLEYSALSEFPSEGETGKIYVDLSSGITYRWTGSTYVEVGVGTYTNANKTTMTVGGIKKGTTFDKIKFTDLITDLLYPYVAFSIKGTTRSAAATTLAYGSSQTLSSATVTITLGSRNIMEITLYNGVQELVKLTNPSVENNKAVTLDFNDITVTQNNNPDLKVVVKDGTSTLEKYLGTSTFVAPYYYGVCATNATINGGLIKSLTPIIKKESDTEVSFTANNQHILFAYPSAYGTLKQIKNQNGQVDTGSFTLLTTVVTGDDGANREYYVYKLTLPTTVTDFGYKFEI